MGYMRKDKQQNVVLSLIVGFAAFLLMNFVGDLVIMLLGTDDGFHVTKILILKFSFAIFLLVTLVSIWISVHQNRKRNG